MLNPEIQTGRLRLIGLHPDALEALSQGWEHLEAKLGIKSADIEIPQEFRNEMPEGIALCLARCKRHPADYAWYTNWVIVLTEETRAIGGIGWNGPPDERGEVFTGYWIDPRYHRRGYMTEAVAAMAAWAFQDPQVRAVTANTPVENIASQRVLLKNGFRQRGEFEGHPFFVLDRP